MLFGRSSAGARMYVRQSPKDMASPDDEADKPMSIRERKKMFESGGTQDSSTFPVLEYTSRPPAVTRSYTTPAIFTTPEEPEEPEERPPLPARPQPSQFTSASEEIIQKTKSGFLDLTERGKTTIQQAGNSMNYFRERVLMGHQRSREESWNYTEDLLRPPGNRQLTKAKSKEELLIDLDSDNESVQSPSPSASIKSAPESKLIDLDRREVCCLLPLWDWRVANERGD